MILFGSSRDLLLTFLDTLDPHWILPGQSGPPLVPLGSPWTGSVLSFDLLETLSGPYPDSLWTLSGPFKDPLWTLGVPSLDPLWTLSGFS